MNTERILQKFSGKGGWTYVDTPEIAMDKHAPFGWVRVSGTIDNHPLERVKLMPKGDGTLFLPVNAHVRKAIGKQAGDQVHLMLSSIPPTDNIPEDLLECFRNEPPALLETFHALNTFQQNIYLEHINDAPTMEIRADRIVNLLNELSKR